MNKFLLLSSVLLFSLSLRANTVPVAPGDGTLKTAITNAASGDILLLSTGEYGVSSNIDISTKNISLTIQASQGANPIIKISSGSIRLKGSGIKLILNSLTLEGTSSVRGIVVNSGIENASLTVNNCIFKQMQRAIYAQDARLTCTDVHITNSTFMHIGDADNRTIYFAPVDGEDDIQYDVTCEIDHCTFYDCNNTRTVYCPAYNGSHVTNCICCNTVEVSGYNGYAVYGKKSYVHNSLAYKTGIKTSSSATQSKCIFLDPLFVDPTNDNLQLYKNSPAVGSGTDGSNLGDPRWGVSQEEYDQSQTPIKDRMVKYPYSMSPTTSSIRILWQQSDSLSLGTVVYGTDGEHFTDTVRSRGGWMVDGEGYVHVVELTGLKPFTRYFFKVGDKKQILDVISSTQTAPKEGTAFRIFTISDIHVNSCKNWQNMQDSICTLGANLMMCNGDFVNNGAGRDWNEALFTPGRPFLSQTPMMSATGNHETGDPLTYRWSTFFDYFSQFSHGVADDSIRDPRGEGYFAYDYGNARILAVSVSGEPSSPLFSKTSKQFKWLENELENAKKDWILIFGHVGLTTTGYHGQWPPEYRDDWRKLFEKYAKEGKKIIYFCGDDHSFEHAYKDGVHYVRPACGRNSNYAQVTTLKDAQYSMFYRQISCYSTLDMAADGSTLHLIARDSASNVFYEYTFYKKGEDITPSLTFTAPGKQTEVTDSVMIQWFLFDPNKDAKVNIYASTTPRLSSSAGLIPIESNIPSSTKKIYWQTRNVSPKGTYYIYAELASNGESYWIPKPEPVTLLEDTIAPPAPTHFYGVIQGDNLKLLWVNPTHLIDLEKRLTDFSDDISCMQEDSEESTSSQMSLVDGTLKVDFSVGNWAQTSVDYVFANATDCHQTPVLHFRLKGNGTSTAIRLICKNMIENHEDWWYTESVKLSSKDWQDFTIDLSSLSAFDWYTNVDTKNHCEGVIRICFAVSTSAQTSGTYYLDDLRLTGQVYPAPDYDKTIIRRSQDAFPETITSGDAVYEGKEETYVDTNAQISEVYYYSAFCLDDRGNVSTPATFCSAYVGIVAPTETTQQAKKQLINGQLQLRCGKKTYSAIGQEL